jgi:hypothetical protein
MRDLVAIVGLFWLQGKYTKELGPGALLVLTLG